MISTFKYKKVNSTHEDMIRAVVAFALSAANIATTSLVAAFLVIINALKANLTAIDALRALIAQSIKGYAAQKKALKFALIEITVVVMKAAYAYAVTTGDSVLAAQMKISRSKLSKMKYVDLVTFVQGAIAIVTPLVASLADYNVTTATIILWQAALTKLDTVLSDPKNAIANREAINKDIQNILRQCMQLLTDQADEVATQFIDNNLKYYNEYRANRKLNPHHFSTQLKATVVDELGQPIMGAIVSIDGSDRSAVTDEKGYALVSHVPFGMRNVTVTTGKISRNYGPFHFLKGHAVINKFTSVPAWSEPPSTTVTPTVEVKS